MDSPFSWRAPEFVYKKKSIDWYWAVAIIALAGSAIAFLKGNGLFAAFVVLAGLALVGFGHRRPRIVSFSIETTGVTAGNIIYPWTRIKSFFIHENDDTETVLLTLYLDRAISAELSIPLPLSIEQEIRNALISHNIPEEIKPRRLIDIVTDLFGF